MNVSPEQDRRRSRWGRPPDSDLIGIPLLLGILAAVVAISLAAVLIGIWAGMIALVVVLVLALAISYRVVISSDIED